MIYRLTDELARRTGKLEDKKKMRFRKEPHGMARPAGFEPTTPWFVACSSNRYFSIIFQYATSSQLYYKTCSAFAVSP